MGSCFATIGGFPTFLSFIENCLLIPETCLGFYDESGWYGYSSFLITKGMARGLCYLEITMFFLLSEPLPLGYVETVLSSKLVCWAGRFWKFSSLEIVFITTWSMTSGSSSSLMVSTNIWLLMCAGESNGPSIWLSSVLLHLRILSYIFELLN